MRFQNTNTIALGIFALSAPANAFFRLPCSQPIVTERADPIVSPGEVSGHVHTIMGGNGFGFDLTYADTQASTCSSCAVTKDLSNYWVPTLYYKGQDGTYQSVEQSGGALIYYLQRTDPNDPLASEGLLAFPEGFRMTAGNPFLRNYTDTLEQQAISYACLGTNNAQTNGFPNYNCPENLRAQVFFPSCWNGVDLDSEDHQSHMAYPSLSDNGFCPESHPHRFISIFYEVQWETNAFADMWYGDEQPFVWSFGDPTGYGYHGDFVSGWDVPTLQNAVTNCNDLSGVITDCPVFDNLYFTADENNGCLIPPTVDEQVFGNLTALPGCNPMQDGPELAVPKSGCGAVDVIGKAENPFVDLTQSKGFQYLGCGTDVAFGADRTLTGASVTLSNLTVESCVAYCEAAGFSIAGMEYSDQCYCGNSMTSGRAPVEGLMGACTMPCSGKETEDCGGAGYISLYQKCKAGDACDNISYLVNTAIGAQPTGISTVSGVVAPTAVSSVAAVSATLSTALSVATKASASVGAVATEASISVGAVATEASTGVGAIATEALPTVGAVATEASTGIGAIATEASPIVGAVATGASVSAGAVATEASTSVGAVTTAASASIPAVVTDTKASATSAVVVPSVVGLASESTSFSTKTLPSATSLTTIFLTSTKFVNPVAATTAATLIPTSSLLAFPSDSVSEVSPLAPGATGCDAAGIPSTVTVTVALSTVTVMVPAPTSGNVGSESGSGSKSGTGSGSQSGFKSGAGSKSGTGSKPGIGSQSGMGSGAESVSVETGIVATSTLAPFPLPTNGTISATGTGTAPGTAIFSTGTAAASGVLPTGYHKFKKHGHMRRHLRSS